jgi:tRNA-modifying protein YgfZ
MLAENSKTPSFALRPDRAFVRVTGDEAAEFLQGLISQDTQKITLNQARYGALLTPQGKFLHDLFLTKIPDGFLLECERERRVDLVTRLKRYRLRAKIDITSDDDLAVAVLWGDGANDAVGLADQPGSTFIEGTRTTYVDPRLPALGVRIIDVPETLTAPPFATESSLDVFRAYRLALGVPEGSGDILVDRGFLLENGFDELNGVDWQKGCYVGQELTARTKYRGLVKRRLMPVRIEGAAPEPGSKIEANGRDAGEIRSVAGEWALALIRLDAWRDGGPMTSGSATVTAQKPDWAAFE